MSEWERRVDPTSQREFWINHATRETSWNPPPNGQPLPQGWEEKRDAQGRVFFIDHNTKKTSWVDPRGSKGQSSSTSTSTSLPVSTQASTSTNGMSDEDYARMLQMEEEEIEVSTSNAQTSQSAPAPAASSSLFSKMMGGKKTETVPVPTPTSTGAAAELDDEELARQLQEEWLEEDSSAAERPRSKSSHDKTLEESVFSSHLQMRHTIQAAGWRRVFARLHGKTFTIYGSESSKTPEVEVDISGAVLGELEAKGGMFSKKEIYRFGLMSKQEVAAKKDDEKPVSKWAAETENDRALWIAHLVLAGAERPEPGLLCRCMLPLLQGAQSQTRTNGLRVLADVTKQAMSAGESGPISAAMHESGVLADVIRCLGDSGDGQEHAARLIFYIGGNADCQAALHKAGAVSNLLDLLTTPDDQLQTWCVAALRPLVAGNAEATATCLESDGIFVLTSLLSSPSPDIQGHALAAICTLLTTCTRDDTVGLDPAKAVEMVGTITNALREAGGYSAMLSAMKGGDSRVVGVATQLVDTLVSLQEQNVIVALRRGGGASILIKMAMTPALTFEVRKAALSILARLTAGDPFDAAPTYREVSGCGGVEFLLHVAGLKREDTGLRELAAVILEHLSGHPDFTDVLIRSGALQKLNAVIADPNMNSSTSSTIEIPTSTGREPPGQPATARALIAYCNIMSNTTRETDILTAIQSNGMDLVAGLLASPHANLATRAIQLLHAFAACKDRTVQALVHAVAGRGSGMVNTLLGRAMDHLSKYQGGNSPSREESNAFTTALMALGSLCGAGCAPGAFPGHGEACSEVCSHSDAIRRLVGVVQGLEPAVQNGGGDTSAVSAASRLFEALCQNGPQECSAQLAKAGALGVVVGRMQKQGVGSGSSERLAALRTFENMCATAPPSSPELPRGVAAVANLFSEDGGSAEVAVRAVQVMRRASDHPQCHAAIVERGAGPLVDLLMGHHPHIADPSVNSRQLVTQVLEIIRNVSSDPKHAAAIVEAGGIFAIANLTETGGPIDPGTHDDGSIAAMATETLGILARHRECRNPILECGTACSSMLHLIAKTVLSNTDEGLENLPPTVVAAIGTLEVLMSSDVKHPSVSAAISRNSDIGPALSKLLTHGDRKLREKAARLLYFAAAASDDGGAFWQALQISAHTAAIVAVLATASLGIKAGHGPNAPAGKLAEQLHVATGACGSLTALCHRTQSKAVEVVNAGGLNYLVQLSSVQNMRSAAYCLRTIIFQTDVHRSTLSDGDGAACDVLLKACIQMLANNSSAPQDIQPDGSPSDAGAILGVAVEILASLCGESDELASRVSNRLTACNIKATAVEHLSAMVQDLKVSLGANESDPPPLSRATSNALVVLSSLLMLNGGSGKLELKPDEVQLVSHISPHLVDLLHSLPRHNNPNAVKTLGVSAPLIRRRLRTCVEGLASVPQCAEAMFTHSRTVPALLELLRPPSKSNVADIDVEEMLTALVTLHHLNVALPGAVPYAIMEVDEAVPSLIFALSGSGEVPIKEPSIEEKFVPTADLLDDVFTTPVVSSPVPVDSSDDIDISSALSEDKAKVRRGSLRLLLDLATAPAGGSRISLRQQLAQHSGLLTAVSSPLREAAESVEVVVPEPAQVPEHVDMLFMQPGTTHDFTTNASPSDVFAADLASLAPPNYDVFSSYDSLPNAPVPVETSPLPPQPPSPQVPKTKRVLKVHSDAVLEGQALAVRLLGELAAADEQVRSKVLSMSGVFDGAVVMLARTEDGKDSAAQGALRSAAARLVRNLTLSLVAGSDDSGKSYPELSSSQVLSLHQTLVAITTCEAIDDEQRDAAADCAWALRTLMAKEEGLDLTKTSECLTRLLECLFKCVTDDTDGNLTLAVPLISVVQSLAQHPNAISVLVSSGLLRTLSRVLQFSTSNVENPGFILAVETSLVLSAVAFHPIARVHSDMHSTLSQLRAIVSAAKNSPTTETIATLVLAPLADRTLAACGHTSMGGVDRSRSSSSAGVDLVPPPVTQPLKVPGWNSGPAVAPSAALPQQPITTSSPIVVAQKPLEIKQVVPTAASIAEAAALAFTNPHSPTPPQTTFNAKSNVSYSNSNSGYGQPTELKWSESEDEALARKLQAEFGSGGGGGGAPSHSTTRDSEMARDEEMALRLQQQDQQGYYPSLPSSSQQKDEPPMPLSSLGNYTPYSPPPPSYGSF
mmetsp:Transcript_13566/g.16155  ORF Transcript_13566/g.16155 Transcript_13566/m.16155 type:complete len:2188 (+) Transcript_13566:81-6644(+)